MPDTLTLPTTKKTGNRTAEEVVARLTELRHDLNELPEYEIRSAEDNVKLQKMFDEVHLLDSELSIIDIIEARESRSLSPLASTVGVGQLERRSLGGAALLENESVRSWIDHGCKAEGFEAQLNFGIDGFQTRNEFEWSASGPGAYVAPGALATGSDATLLPVGQPIPPVPGQAKLYLRDLMPSMTHHAGPGPLRPRANADARSSSALGRG